MFIRHRELLYAALAGSLAAGLPVWAETAAIRVIARDTQSTTGTASAPVRTIEIHDVRARNARTRLRVETVADPLAVAVLFAGGKGAMQLSQDGAIGWGRGNFLIRARPLFSRNGIITAIIDAPSDHPRDLDNGFRSSPEHAADIGAVIGHLRQTYQVPVWLVGTSRGTVSVANAAARTGGRKPDGIVLTASVLVANRRGGQLFDFDLGAIALPVLIAHHRGDRCRVTPPDKIAALTAALKRARPLKTLLYEGGIATGNPCKARHYHGFNGIEDQVIADIAAWIKAPTP